MLHIGNEVEHDDGPQRPIDKLGFGITAYIQLLEHLFYLFALLSAVAVVAMITFYKANENGILSNSIAKYSLGNIGFTQTICINKFKLFQNRPTNLSC